jgi:hypothetical protein
LLIRLGKKFGLYYEPECLGSLREYEEAKTSSGGARRIEEIRRVLKRHTGLEKAPGYLTYGWQSRQEDFRRNLARKLPKGLEWLSWGPGVGAWTLSAAAIEVVSRRAQGFYGGWASDRLRWMLPEGSGEVVVRGETPDKPAFSSQALIAVADGIELARTSVGRGNFEFRFRAPDGHEGVFSFQIHSTRWAPRLAGGRLNWRRAAFRLIDIAWASRSTEPCSGALTARG